MGLIRGDARAKRGLSLLTFSFFVCGKKKEKGSIQRSRQTIGEQAWGGGVWEGAGGCGGGVVQGGGVVGERWVFL